MASRLLDLLFIKALRAWSDADGAGGSPGRLTAALDRALGPALRAIHRHPEQSWTVEELAGLASLSLKVTSQAPGYPSRSSSQRSWT
ncbi:hypothetical protein AADR41_10785 [Streptomyces sp. CLV115]|uniref:hypothetical protein n=1 Tax=Streptomyces sp. CLV115 TaxID=3138502 RepID=UPI00313E6591